MRRVRYMTRRERAVRGLKRAEVVLGSVALGTFAGGMAGEFACGGPMNPLAIECAAVGAAIGMRSGYSEGKILAKKFINGNRRRR